MARRHVFDDANPFAPELREWRAAAATKRGKPLAAAQDEIHARARAKAPTFERVRTRLHGMDVYSRHKELINNYVLYHSGSTAKMQRDTFNHRNVYDVIRDNHRFLWNDEDDPTKPSTSSSSGDDVDSVQRAWEAKLAKKYYDKLFKEYCIADLSRYQSNQVAMRWRVEREVFSGKGQFECGSKHCTEREALSSWEVNFAYVEHGERKNALVKLRLCPNCSAKLNFHSTKRLIKKEKKEKNAEKRVYEKRSRRKKSDSSGRKRRKHGEVHSSSSSSSSSNDEDDDGDGLSGANVKQEPTATNEEEEETNAAEAKTNTAKMAEDAAEIWRRKAAVVDAEKTVEDEFDEFLDDLLL